MGTIFVFLHSQPFTNISGIGYFTLTYLVHSMAQHLHACEWNLDAVDALKKNLRLNKVEDRCTIYQGDNKEVSYNVRFCCYTMMLFYRGCRSRDRMVVGFIITYIISAYHH